MKNFKYWNKFYQTFSVVRETSFARFVLKKINKKKTILEIGCGNGRDTFFFLKNKINITGIDISRVAIKKNKIKNNIPFQCFDFCKKNFFKKNFDYIYARFFIHAINEKQENFFFKNCIRSTKPSSLIFLEFRTTKDNLIKKGKHLSKNERVSSHYRRFIDVNEFIKKIKKLGFILVYLRRSKNFAKFNKEKPDICRVILKKTKRKKVTKII